MRTIEFPRLLKRERTADVRSARTSQEQSDARQNVEKKQVRSMSRGVA